MALISVSALHAVFTMNGHVFDKIAQDANSIMLPEESEFATYEEGSGGEFIVFDTGILGGPISVTVLPNSASIPFMFEMISRTKNQEPVDWNGSLFNTSTLITSQFTDCRLLMGPQGLGYGKTTNNLKFTWLCQYIDTDAGAANFRRTMRGARAAASVGGGGSSLVL